MDSHPMAGGLIVPPQPLDPQFEAWLRQRYGNTLRLAYNRTLNRYGLLTPSIEARGWVCLLVLEAEDGGFLPLGEKAKSQIVSRVIPARDAVADFRAKKQLGADMKEKELTDYRNFVRDVFWEDRRQAFKRPVVRVPVTVRRGKVVV